MDRQQREEPTEGSGWRRACLGCWAQRRWCLLLLLLLLILRLGIVVMGRRRAGPVGRTRTIGAARGSRRRRHAQHAQQVVHVAGDGLLLGIVAVLVLLHHFAVAVGLHKSVFVLRVHLTERVRRGRRQTKIGPVREGDRFDVPEMDQVGFQGSGVRNVELEGKQGKGLRPELSGRIDGGVGVDVVVQLDEMLGVVPRGGAAGVLVFDAPHRGQDRI
jgi:hypothetical protein